MCDLLHGAEYEGHIPYMSTGNVPLIARPQIGDSSLMSETVKKDIIQRVEKRAKELKMSVRAVSLAAGFGPDLIRDWKGPKAALPRIDTLQQVARALRVPAGWLAFGETPDLPKAEEVPLISWVAAGQFSEAPAQWDSGDYEKVIADGLRAGTHFALTVRGDSMNLIAPQGSTIIVNADDRELVSRAYYVFRQGDEATFKQFMSNPDRLEPVSMDRSYEALPITPDTTIVGRVERIIIPV